MKKIIKFVKTHKKLTLISLLIIVFIPIPIIHFLFKWNSNVDILSAEWTAGEILAYIGTIIAALGSIFLGIFAMFATDEANTLTKRVAEIEENRYKLDLRPFVIVTDCQAKEFNKELLFESNMINLSRKLSISEKEGKSLFVCIGKHEESNQLGVILKLTNTSNHFITIQYDNALCKNGNWTNAMVNARNLKMCLSAGEIGTMVFYADSEVFERNTSVKLEFILENHSSKRYKESFNLIFINLTKQKKESEEWDCLISAQDYNIGHYEKDCKGNSILVEEDL